jgi:molybdopterin converting factor small subunit
MVVVSLPPPLQRLFQGLPARMEVEARTVAEALACLDARFPGLRDRLCDSTPKIRRTVNVFVGGKRAGLDTPLQPGTEIVILPGVLG